MPKIGFISLGCPKNQVDAELMLDKLVKAGYAIAGAAEEADAVIVNTCGFIDAAKQEAIDNILEMGQLKADGVIQKIIVTGWRSATATKSSRKCRRWTRWWAWGPTPTS